VLDWILKKINQMLCAHRKNNYTFDIDWNTDLHVDKCRLCDLIETKFVTRPGKLCHTGEHLLSECPGDHGK